MHMDECLSSLPFSEKSEMEGGKKLPYTTVNDLSGDRECSATKHNNQSALKITSKYSLLASRSPGAISSPLWGLVRNVPMNLGWIILGQSCQNIGNAQWKEHSCRLTFLDSGICIHEETKGPISALSRGKRIEVSHALSIPGIFLGVVHMFTHWISFNNHERMVALVSFFRLRNFELWKSKETYVRSHTCKWWNQLGNHDCPDLRPVLFAHPCCLWSGF